MTTAESPPSHPAGPSTDPPPAMVPISSGELLWLTLGMWLGGVAILTVLPVVLVTLFRLGDFVGVVGSYTLFFVAWQPVQTLTQRALGTRAALMRMLLLVVSAFSVAFVLRLALFGAPE
jgi:hypothetical protein